ncbi:MAG TPA: hypothetical protein VIR98_02410 [Candidatus Paceibacterota bacterium]|jgi:hypothetical protein
MADKKDKPKPEPLHKEFAWFIWPLVGLGILWFFMGGPSNPTAHQGQYIKPLAPIDTGEAYGKYYAGEPTAKKETVDLPEAPVTLIRWIEWPFRKLFGI